MVAALVLAVRDDTAEKLDWSFPKDGLPNLELQELETSMAPSTDRKDTSSSVKTGNGIHASIPSHCGVRCEGLEASHTRIRNSPRVILGGYQFHAPSLLPHLGIDV